MLRSFYFILFLRRLDTFHLIHYIFRLHNKHNLSKTKKNMSLSVQLVDSDVNYANE